LRYITERPFLAPVTSDYDEINHKVDVELERINKINFANESFMNHDVGIIFFRNVFLCSGPDLLEILTQCPFCSDMGIFDNCKEEERWALDHLFNSHTEIVNEKLY
jgi:hypothetical protein